MDNFSCGIMNVVKHFQLNYTRKTFPEKAQTEKTSFFTLSNAAVLVLWLHHLYGIIFQVEVDVTLSDSVCLISCLSYSFLKVCFKTQSLEEQGGIL